MFKEFRIEVFVPVDSFDEFVEKLKNQPIGIIGNYKNCQNWHKVDSSWIATEGAHPFLGEINKKFKTEEYKLAFKCSKENVLNVVNYIKEIHPYEEVGIDIIPLLDLDYFKLLYNIK